MLAHTLAVAARSGGEVAVVTGDPGVARWTKGRDLQVLPEPPGGGLDGAALAAVEAAGRLGIPWAVVHADLPLLDAADLRAVEEALAGADLVLAPSRDGGTTVVAGRLGRFPFRYGPGSFHRHLGRGVRLGARVRVLVRAGLALDLDGPGDLAALRRHRRGRWIEEHL